MSDVDLSAPFVASVPSFLTIPWSGAQPRGQYTLFLAVVVQGGLADGRVDRGDIVAIGFPYTFMSQ